jgi:carbamate kinase
VAEPAHALVLVALGGNAVIRQGQTTTYEAQGETLRSSLAVVVELIRRGCRVLITHGNGPQVGHILLRVEAARGQAYGLPLDACVAQSQGELGYLIQQCLQNLLHRAGLARPVATLLTRTVVDKRDPRMQHPTKPVGPHYTRGHAAAMEQRGYHVAPEPSGGYRRVVPSPWPLRIVEEESIRQLIKQDVIVIAAGGGGIPVHVEADGTLTGVEAVVDKDLASAVLAVGLGVERIVNLTAVEHAKLRFGTPEEQDLARLTVTEAESYLKEGHFAPGSMGPKVESAIWFLGRGGKEFIITTPERGIDALEGKTGTHIFSNGR